jgi:uncharacterized membrane protein YoaK (UPF0700 family)
MESREHGGALRLRDASAVALAITSGATDALSFLALSGAFTSVMTGNLVLLGISLRHTNGALAQQITVAIIGYITGCAVGVRIAGIANSDDPVWPPAVARALAVESCMFILYAAGWWVGGAKPAGALAAGLLGLSGLALGIQSATVQRFGVSGLSTTYLTGTLTTLVIRLVTRRRSRDDSRQLLILVGLVVGAALAAVLDLCARDLAPLMQLVPLGIALGIVGWQVRRRRPPKARDLPAPGPSGADGS